MGFGDKLKDLTKQAQEAVAERKDQIHGAIETASTVADQKTRGKYTAKIAKAGQKAAGAVDKFAQGAPGAEGAGQEGEARRGAQEGEARRGAAGG